MKKKRESKGDFLEIDSDENFAFIAGYTSGGFAYGIKHDEMENIDKDNNMTVLNIIEKIINDYVQTKRPPVEIRDEVDIGYSYKNGEVILFEIRPQWNDKTKIHQHPFARVKYVKTQKVWKIYWMRANGKWELYEPVSQVNDINSFIEVIENDKHGCFWG